MKQDVTWRASFIVAAVLAVASVLIAGPAAASHGGGHGGGGFHGGGGGSRGGFAAAPAVRGMAGFRGGVAGTVPSGVAPLHGGVIHGAFPRPGFNHGFRGPRFGVIVGGPIFYSPYGYGYGYYPPPPPSYYYGPNYDSSGYWYYCPALGAYYPDVQECPGGWQPVVPQ